MPSMTRRSFAGSALAVSTAAALGSTVLSGCSSSPAPGGASNGSVASLLPHHIPYTGVKPDYPALSDSTPAGFTNYPAHPQVAYRGKPGDGTKITGISQLNGPLPPALGKNPYWQELNRRLGSPIEIQEVTAGADFVAKIATIEASGDLPDLMQLSPAVPSLGQFVQAKMVDLAPYLEGDKISKYPFLANIPTDFWRGCVYGGRLAGIPISRGAASSRVMFYRADVLAKLGINSVEVNSFQDFANLVGEVTSARANRWGLAASPLDYIRQMYAIPNNFARQKDGSFVSAYEDARQKDALEASRKLQAKGVINPDMASAQPAQRSQWFISGTGAFNWSPYTGWPGASGSATPTEPGTRIGLLPVPGFDGGTGRGWVGALNNNMVSIPSSAKDRIETLLAVIDWLAAPFGTDEYLFQHYGIEGVHYTLKGTNPQPVVAKANDLSLGINYLGAGPYVLYDTQDPTFVPTVHTHMATFMRNATVDPTNLYYSATFGSTGARLTSAIQAVELDIIYGRRSVSSWDSAVRDYLDGGGTQIKSELAEAAKDA